MTSNVCVDEEIEINDVEGYCSDYEFECNILTSTETRKRYFRETAP